MVGLVQHPVAGQGFGSFSPAPGIGSATGGFGQGSIPGSPGLFKMAVDQGFIAFCHFPPCKKIREVGQGVPVRGHKEQSRNSGDSLLKTNHEHADGQAADVHVC